MKLRARVRSVWRTSVFACASLATALLALPADAQQDAEYRRRFMEELQRKIPPVNIPAPTAAEAAAPKAPAANAIDLAAARALMGLTQPAAAARIPGGKLAIVDSGFAGLKEWLEANPREKALVSAHTAVDSLKWATSDVVSADLGTSDHGYLVYRVVRAVLPDVQVLAYRVTDLVTTATALLDASTRGVVVSNVSLGFDAIFENYNEQEDSLSKNMRLYLPQYEPAVFIAAGNERGRVHSFVSADSNSNGLVDFRPNPMQGGSIDALRARFQPVTGRPTWVSLTWDTKSFPEADYELQVTAAGGSPVYYSARVQPNARVKGLIEMRPRFSEVVNGEVRVRRLAGPASGVAMRVRVDPGALPADFNGLQTANAYLHRENPFVSYVGSFGRTADGKLAPSSFSNIGTMADGRLVPHVLGPGQLLVDGKPTNGTSFSSPFLTALYATQVGYNFKNLIARTSNFTRFAAGVAPHERSRWGIPDPNLLAKMDSVVGPTKIEGVSHAVEDEHLVLRFAVTRCCMESLTWSIVASLTDAQNGQPIKGADGNPVSGSAAMRGDKADFAKHPTEIKIPMAALADAKGKKLRVAFDIKVRRWANPPPDAIKIDQADAHDVSL